MMMLRFALLTAAALLWAVGVAGRAQVPAQDRGAVAAWQKLLKLRTTASAMHTTAHPDDEHGGMLALLSRGQGVRVSLLTLTRGESGDNAIGPELFDALGLIRTEELLVAGRYYGVDDQYFTSAVDYGFSKRLDEALNKWGRDHVLRDIVRIIRTDRPMAIISRFQGNPRDGHGNHEAAGLLTRDAFRMAGDPGVFPDQIGAGLRPWQPLKLYVGGVRENEDWNVRLDPGTYDAVLGDSYQAIARAGLGFQRSQNAGRVGSQAGPAVFYYKQLDAAPGLDVAAKEQSFFDGIDTTLPGLYRALRRSSPPGAIQALSDIDREIQAAIDAFQFTDPSGCVPALARALRATGHAAVLLGSDPDVKFVLGVKQHQILEAIHGALGVDLTGFAQPADAPATPGPFIAGPAPMGPVVPGQAFEVRASFVNRSPATVEHVQLRVEGRGNWSVSGTAAPAAAPTNLPVVQTFKVVAPEEAITRPRFTRASIQSARYTVADEAAVARPAGHSGLEVVAQYDIAGIPVEIRRPVLRVEANLPYGLDARSLAVVPAMSISLSPAHAIVPTSNPSGPVRVRAEIVTNKAGQSDGLLTLKVPAGWTAMPAEQAFSFTRAGERAFYEFEVKVSALGTGTARLEAVARAAGREYREGYETIRHRDLDTRHLFRQAVTMVRGVDVRIAPGLRVGYVMGIGDDVPAGIAQLGADVQLLGERDLASGDLTRFHAIITGTRAYAVRDDLRTYNRRLLDYVRAGGNLIVLYNTQELVPNLHAPYPGDLPRNAEEVSEEDSAVEILAADAPVLTSPNRITPADFDGWVEQRGSKFWSAWDPRYAPLIATWDTGQSPQKGGWLHARYGRGHYTYFAYAFHRQLPYGVPGAYRLLANLLSLNSSAGAARR